MSTPSPLDAWRASQGFWNLDAEPGVRQAVASWRFAQDGGLAGSWASQAAWSADDADALMRRMLGLPPGSPLLDLFDPAACWRALCLAALVQSSPAAEFAEAVQGPASHAARAATARFCAFDQNAILAIGAGFERLGSSCGAATRHSHPKLAEAARALALSWGLFEFDPAAGSAPAPGVREERDILRISDPRDGCAHWFDMRGCAMALGAPARAALAVPAWDAGPSSPSLLSPEAVRRAIEALGDQAFSLPSRSRVGHGRAGQERAIEELAAIQEGLALSAETRRPAKNARATSL